MICIWIILFVVNLIECFVWYNRIFCLMLYYNNIFLFDVYVRIFGISKNDFVVWIFIFIFSESMGFLGVLLWVYCNDN